MDSSATWPCPALPSASLAGRTTLKVGGAVEWLVEPGDPDALREVWLAALEAGYRFDAADPNAGTLRVLGGGANLIVADGELPDGTRQGTTDFGRTGYGGPCPPEGREHRYVFSVYALDSQIELPPGATGALTRFVIAQHTLAYGEIVGTYRRP